MAMGPPPPRSLLDTPAVGRRGRIADTSIASTCSSVRFRTPAATSTTSLNNSRRREAILAIFQGRGGQGQTQIGLACVPFPSPSIVLCEYMDGQNYQKTLAKVEVFEPKEIVMASTACEPTNRLFTQLQQNCPEYRIVPIDRKYFQERRGIDHLRKIVNDHFKAVISEVATKPVALAAAAALLRCLEINLSLNFADGCVKLEFQGPEKTMLIDNVTSKHLELVMNNYSLNQKNTLFGIFARDCRTPIGTRQLRNNILEPLCNEAAIAQRMDCVEELLEDGELLYKIQAALSKLPVDIDQMIYGLVQQPNYDNDKLFEHRVNLMISLKHTLTVLSFFSEALQNANHAYFRGLAQAFSNPKFQSMLEKISAVINSEAQFQRGASRMKMQRIFAVKSNVNPILDVARKVYCEIMEDTKEYVLELCREHNYPFEFVDSTVKGFHLRLRLRGRDVLENLVLPPAFIRVHTARSVVTFTTEALLIADRRVREVTGEIDNISYTVISQLVQTVKEDLPNLYAVSEAVSKIDVLQSLAIYAATANCVRPSFSSCCTAIEGGRHPVLPKILNEPTVANSTFLTPFTNVKIITGPNMSGKSTYLKQVALLQILAQIGSFVPAESATFRIADSIFSRMGGEDCLEENVSSFAVEITEMRYILETVTATSLVLIDELGRSTSHEEGTAIAWAILEELQRTTAFSLCATHFLFLTKMESLYHNVLNYELVTSQVERNRPVQDVGPVVSMLKYTHILRRGITDVELYGLHLAEISAIPNSITKRAREIAEVILQNRKKNASVQSIASVEKYLVGVIEYLKSQEPMVASNETLIKFLTDTSMVTDSAMQDISVSSIFSTQRERNISTGSSSQLSLKSVPGSDAGASHDESVDVNSTPGDRRQQILRTLRDLTESESSTQSSATHRSSVTNKTLSSYFQQVNESVDENVQQQNFEDSRQSSTGSRLVIDERSMDEESNSSASSIGMLEQNERSEIRQSTSSGVASPVDSNLQDLFGEDQEEGHLPEFSYFNGNQAGSSNFLHPSSCSVDFEFALFNLNPKGSTIANISSDDESEHEL